METITQVSTATSNQKDGIHVIYKDMLTWTGSEFHEPTVQNSCAILICMFEQCMDQYTMSTR